MKIFAIICLGAVLGSVLWLGLYNPPVSSKSVEQTLPASQFIGGDAAQPNAKK